MSSNNPSVSHSLDSSLYTRELHLKGWERGCSEFHFIRKGFHGYKAHKHPPTKLPCVKGSEAASREWMTTRCVVRAAMWPSRSETWRASVRVWGIVSSLNCNLSLLKHRSVMPSDVLVLCVFNYVWNVAIECLADFIKYIAVISDHLIFVVAIYCVIYDSCSFG